MVYVSSSGTLTERKSFFRASIFSDILWGVVNFVGMFFRTIVNPIDPETRQPYQRREPAFGRGGGGGARQPPPKRTNIKGMDALKKQGGACGAAGG
mmetsp:Transcript_49361/g.112018  ORF Transcript_49361/g.112018 Transcript_49361/m.112018 type:complete len:96 (+) Transcript_49361:213-500(+)